VQALRDEVNRIIERKRAAGELGASLEAEVDVWCNGALRQSLDALGDELRFAMITSRATVRPADAPPEAAEAATLTAGGVKDAGVWLRVTPSTHAKCVRCWHRRPDVGSDAAHPELCGRCVENVTGAGETRRFA
jgi:isoleucyl-tRNA synthetase